MAKEFLGRGLAFPVEVDDAGLLPQATAESKVQQSLLLILGTARGERVMNPEFGSRLHELLFEPNHAGTRGRVVRLVTEAVIQWEPRIELMRVDVTTDTTMPSKLLVDIEYRIRATNSRFNLVYPFYLREGSHANAPA